MGLQITSGDHLRKLGVVGTGSEMTGVWGCMMIWFLLLFVVVGLVPQWMGVQKEIQWLLLHLKLSELQEVQ